MALIQCPECQSEVSSEALDCPKCGKSLKKLQRSIFGKFIKWTFILFNLLMLWWMIGGMSSASQSISSEASSAGRAGAAIGTGIGFIMILIIWVFGDIILGLFTLLTRPKR